MQDWVELRYVKMTHDLSVASPTPYHSATRQHLVITGYWYQQAGVKDAMAR